MHLTLFKSRDAVSLKSDVKLNRIYLCPRSLTCTLRVNYAWNPYVLNDARDQLEFESNNYTNVLHLVRLINLNN